MKYPISSCISLFITLHGLIHHGKCLFVHIQHHHTFLTFSRHGLVLLEKLIEQSLLVQLGDQPVLYHLSTIINQQMHNGFRHAISNGFPGDVEVRCDEGPCVTDEIYKMLI